MKLKTTKKAVKNHYTKIYSIGYCDAYYLLQGIEPFAYSSASYGWDCDYYEVNGVCISTGYRSIGESINYQLVEKYEGKAKKVFDNYNLDYQKRKNKVNKLLVKLINELETIKKQQYEYNIPKP